MSVLAPLAALGLVAVVPSAAFAIPLTVTSTADVATDFGACGNPGQMGSSGSLREAICAANNAGATSSTINVAPGTYTLTNGELQMGKVAGSNITLIGAGAGSTIISGNNASRVLDLDPNLAGGVTTTISGVTITQGKDSTFGGAGIIGGSGTATTGDTLTLSNSVLSSNVVNATTANKPGGALQFMGGSLTITNSTFTGNSSGSSPGSAVEYAHQDAASGEQLTISGSTFSGNSVSATVANVKVGGALHLGGRGASAPMSITNSTFTGNSVVGSGSGLPQGGAILAGGGVLTGVGGNVTITESTFTGNSVTGVGAPAGGALSVIGPTVTMHYNRITGNTAATASGVNLDTASGSSVNASDNWWGCNAGPGTAGCDTVAGSPTVSPRMVLSASASPATVVGPNATSTITAALTQDSLGSAISASNLDAFAGLPVAWSDPLPSGATLGSSSSNVSSGAASATYNSQSTSGPGHVLATLDNATATATVTVNRAPSITSASTVSSTVGTPASFTVTTTGYPAAAVTKTGTVPPGMTFTDNGNGTATLAGTPTAGGSYPLSLTANNGVSPNATQTLTVAISQAPTFTSSNSAAFTVGTAGSKTITTTSTAYPTPSITKTGTLPSGLTFTDNGDGTATLSGTPAAGTGGVYTVNLTASNGVDPNGTQTLTVNVSQAPAVTVNPSSQTVMAGSTVSFSSAASGFPTPTVQWQRSTDGGGSYSNIAGATSSTYTFTSALSDDGNRYRAVWSNGSGTATSTSATLTVQGSPQFTSSDHTTFAVGSAGSFTVTTSGGTGPVTLTKTGSLPSGVSFTDNGDGTATLAGTPANGTGGSYSLTLKASDGATPDTTQSFTLTVSELPRVTSADHATFLVGSGGDFSVTTTAGYPAATTLTETGTLPSGVSFTDNGDGTATLSGTPAPGTGGTYPLTLSATNGSGTRQQAFTLTVSEPPSITSADHTTFSKGSAGSFTVTTAPGQPTARTITKSGALPAGVTFTDNGDGTATLAGTPTETGSFPITITASNGIEPTPSQSFTLTVTALPSITSPAGAPFTIGSAATFLVTTAPGYPSATTLTETGPLPEGVSFTDNGDGTASLSGTAVAGTAGTYPLTITATNATGSVDQSFTLTVAKVAQDLAFSSVAPVSPVVGQTYAVTTTPGASGHPVQLSVDGASCTLAGSTVTFTHPGVCTVQADQAGDDEYQAATVTQTIAATKAATSTDLVVHAHDLTATVEPVAPGAGSPSGDVVFRVEDEIVGTAPLADGVATLALNLPTGASHAVSAAYSGDDDFTGSSASTSRTDPTITASLSSENPPTRFGWHRGPVTVTFTCTPHGSPLVGECPAPFTFKHEASGRSLTRTVVAEDGGAATVTVSGVNIDRHKPTVRITGVRDGATYVGSPPQARCVARDDLSGIASCRLVRHVHGSMVRLQARARDKAGNLRLTSVRFTVVRHRG